MVLVGLAGASATWAEEATPTPEAPQPGVPIPADGPKFQITEFVFEYAYQAGHPQLPDLADLQEIRVKLGKTDTGYVAPRDGLEIVPLRLGDVPADALQQFYASAILRVNQAVRDHFNNVYKLVGVYIAPHPEDIEEIPTEREVTEGDQTKRITTLTPTDVRKDRTTLREQIWIGVVTKTRTIASGKRIPADHRINNKNHQHVVEGSPVRPAGDYSAGLIAEGLLQEDTIERVTRRSDEFGKSFVVTVGKLKDTGEQVDQAYHYPAISWTEQEARLHADKAGAIFREGPIERKDLMFKDLLDEYVFRLSRHPGRRVDVAVAAAGKERGQVALDFLVTENKPWIAYFQMSNTGTESTGEWRERFGFVHNQFTGGDDIFSIDYSTANFDDSQVLTVSYEAPLLGCDHVRWRTQGSWNEFTASDLGIADLEYEGSGWNVGGDLIINVFQKHDVFADLVVGGELRQVAVENTTTGDEAETGFLVPHVGMRAECVKDTCAFYGGVDFEWTQRGVWGDDQANLVKLGRYEPDEDWEVLKWDMACSFYLEPLLNRRGWEDPNSRWATLAHEVALAFRGQHGLNNRLIPHAEQVVGGMYTVRGYRQSIVSGDTALIANAEYRFHIPNAINPNRQVSKKDQARGVVRLWGQRFRYMPPHPYGIADWDLIFRTFFDFGRTLNTRRSSIETNETLVSTGLGVELKIKENFGVRLDWGFALHGADDGGTDSGDNRCHFVVTCLY